MNKPLKTFLCCCGAAIKSRETKGWDTFLGMCQAMGHVGPGHRKISRRQWRVLRQDEYERGLRLSHRLSGVIDVPDKG